MISKRFLRGLGIALMLTSAPFGSTVTYAADASEMTLETELADEIASQLIETYNSASEPGFETFERLFDAHETIRKWEAYLEAIDAAKLPQTTGPYMRLKSAVERLREASIDASAFAASAIDALRGLDNWHAKDKAQADLVIQHLGKLVTELTDPRQRLIGQSILAEVELDSDAPMAAANRIVAAVADIRRLDDHPEQLQFAIQFATMLQSLDGPQTIEVTSEIVAAIAAEQRADLVAAIADGFLGKARARLEAAAASPSSMTDPLARVWSTHGPSAATTPEAAALEVGGGVDPLPVLIALAAGVPPEARQAICSQLVDELTARGEAIRALNLRKMLGRKDCSPATAVTLASRFADSGFPNLAGPLLDEVFEDADGDRGLLLRAAHALEALGDPARLEANASTLTSALGPELPAIAARTAIRALLADRSLDGQPMTERHSSAIAAYAPAVAMYSLLSGGNASTTDSLSSTEDLALFRDIGDHLAQTADGAERLATFAASDAPLQDRLAAAAGYTGALSFNLAADAQLSSALIALTGSPDAAETSDGASLLASLGDLDPRSLGDVELRDALLIRSARQLAWSGDQAGATAATQHVTDADVAAKLRLDIAAIAAVIGDFEAATAEIRNHPDSAERTAALRFVARQRAERLDIHDWMGGGAPLDLEPVELINASASTGDGPVVHYDDRLTVRSSGASLPTGRPALPDLDVTSSDVTHAVPYPRGGSAGIVISGGRHIRLGGFDSPYFDGESNNGVRDYIYEQNRTITPEFIFLNSGTFTIADVIDAIGRNQAEAIELLPDGVVRINRPVAIGADATLILSGEEAREIQLNATTGAFLVNAGTLDVVGVRVVGFDVENNTELRRGYESTMHKFRPFILGWSGSRTNLADSEFVALGYSASRSYGMTFNSGPVDDYYARVRPAAPTGIIVNNSFDNLYYGFYTYEAADVQLVGNEYRNSIVYGIDPHDRSRRLNISFNSAYGTTKKHGIIISREVNDSFIVGNLSFDNYGSGAMLDRSSVGTLVFANTLRSNHGDGMAVFESPCTIVGMNDVGGNNRAGIKVRNSWDVLLLQNLIDGNKGSAIEGFISDLAASEGSAGRNFTLDPYQPVTTFSAVGNAVYGNGAGIQTAGASEVELYANQFRNQSHRLVAGDLDGLQGLLLQEAGSRPMVVAANCRPVLQPMHACPFTDSGLIAATRFSTSQTGDFCTGDEATPQAQAFSMVPQ